VQSPATGAIPCNRAQGFERCFVLSWRGHKAGEQEQGVYLTHFGERYCGNGKAAGRGDRAAFYRSNREGVVGLVLDGVGKFEGRLHAQSKKLEAGVSTIETCGMRPPNGMS
jgi:hypothetical protein